MSITSEIVQLVQDTGATDAFCEFAEVALDCTLEDGVLKEIPVVGSLFRLGGAAFTINDRIFIRKISAFLNKLDEIPKQKRQKFLQGMDDQDERQKVGEKLILILNRQDDFDKAGWIGILFSEYMLGNINRHDFEALSHSISNAFLPDLVGLSLIDIRTFSDDALGLMLVSYGLAQIKVEVISIDGGNYDDGPSSETKNYYTLTRYGKLLAEIMGRHKEGEHDAPSNCG